MKLEEMSVEHNTTREKPYNLHHHLQQKYKSKQLYLSLRIWLSNFGSQVLTFLVNQNCQNRRAKFGERSPFLASQVLTFCLARLPKLESQNLRAKIGERSPVLASQVLAPKTPKPESQIWRAKIGD